MFISPLDTQVLFKKQQYFLCYTHFFDAFTLCEEYMRATAVIMIKRDKTCPLTEKILEVEFKSVTETDSLVYR